MLAVHGVVYILEVDPPKKQGTGWVIDLKLQDRQKNQQGTVRTDTYAASMWTSTEADANLWIERYLIKDTFLEIKWGLLESNEKTMKDGKTFYNRRIKLFPNTSQTIPTE